MSAIRRSTGDLRASNRARDDQDDAATYVASYLDLHGGGRVQPPQATTPYRFMKKGISDKNAESARMHAEPRPAGKRHAHSSLFASTFSTHMRAEEAARQERRRAADDSGVQLLQGGGSARKEYRRSDVVNVQYLSVSPPPNTVLSDNRTH